MNHWLEKLAMVFGPQAKINLNIDTMNFVTLEVTVNRQGHDYLFGHRMSWETIEGANVDPIVTCAEQIIREWFRYRA